MLFSSIFFQCLFDAWLTEKEDALSKIHTTGFKDQNEMLTSLRKLAVCIFYCPVLCSAFPFMNMSARDFILLSVNTV